MMVDTIKQVGLLKITGIVLGFVVTVSISIIAWNAQIGYSMIKENRDDIKNETIARYKQNETIIVVAQNQKNVIENQKAIIKKIDVLEECTHENEERLIILENLRGAMMIPFWSNASKLVRMTIIICGTITLIASMYFGVFKDILGLFN